MHSLAIDRVTKDYGSFRAIRDVSFIVEDGEFCVFVGPSGCGKSTSCASSPASRTFDLRATSTSTAGRVNLTLWPSGREIAMVFQYFALYPRLTIRDNIGLGLLRAGRPARKSTSVVTARRRSARPRPANSTVPRAAELSGGQQTARRHRPRHRPRPQALPVRRAPLQPRRRAAVKDQPRNPPPAPCAAATMIYVTHDQVEAMTLADRIVVLNAGRIEQVGRPMELYNDPANRLRRRLSSARRR